MRYLLSGAVFKQHRYRRTALLASVTWMMTTLGVGNSLPNETCEYPDVGNRFVSPDERGGEFLILLSPPDYQSVDSVRNHFVFAATLGRLLASRLSADSAGQCSAVITPSRFPNLHAFLVVNPASGYKARSQCSETLSRLLLEFDPTPASIALSSVAEAKLRRETIDNSGGDFSDAANLLYAVLPSIYVQNSVLGTIYAVRPEQFQSVNPVDVRSWLVNQRAGNDLRLAKINQCPVGQYPQTQFSNVVTHLPKSDVVRPGRIALSQVKSSRVAEGRSRHVVIVGSKGTWNAPLLSSRMSALRQRYCNREIEVASAAGAQNEFSTKVRVDCLSTANYENDVWILFFCRPDECASEQTEKAMAETIAGDPDALLQSDAGDKGPYLISIDAVHEK